MEDLKYTGKIHYKNGSFKGSVVGEVSAPNVKQAKEQLRTVFKETLKDWLAEQEGLKDCKLVEVEVKLIS